MKTFNSLSSVVILLFLGFTSQAQVSKDMLSDFNSNDWKVVKIVKISLENKQADAIPNLIKLLDSNERIKLSNTGSLIYPGAEKFYGHGQILNYDVDYTNIRAGWLIEEISFNNFGFSALHLQKNELITNIKITFPAYYNNSSNRKKLDAASGESLRKIAQELSVNSVKVWWKSEGSKWTRLDALLSALKSFDEKRQVKALFYLRNGTTKCEGLTKDFYYEEISKEIVRLSGSDVQRISEHAKLILLDSKLNWLTMKTK